MSTQKRKSHPGMDLQRGVEELDAYVIEDEINREIDREMQPVRTRSVRPVNAL
jgi:hypothetical protein